MNTIVFIVVEQNYRFKAAFDFINRVLNFRDTAFYEKELNVLNEVLKYSSNFTCN